MYREPTQRALSGEQAGRYGHAGVLFPIPVLSAEEVLRFRSAFETMAGHPNGRPQPIRLPHLNVPWAYDLATHPAVLDAVEDILGPDILVHASIIFHKPADDASYVSWHQDGLYPGMDSPHVLSAWIALSDSTPKNGCMRVVPGSHKQGILPHTERVTKDNLLQQGQAVDIDVDESRVLDVILKAGEMSLHHSNIIHGSNPNRSGTERIGFIVRYVSPDVRLAAKHPAVLARGQDIYHHYELLEASPAIG